MIRRYPIYKGLQKPLIYRGFKGKFIAWGIASLVIGLVSGGIIGALTTMYLGGAITIITVAGGLFFTFQKQKNGLHAKTRHRGVFVQPAHFQSYGIPTEKHF